MPIPLIFAIQRATHGIARFLDAQPDLQVTPAEAHVLAYLTARGDSTVGQIHLTFGYKRSTLTSILNRLEERSLITCQVNDADRRSLMIGLTPAGEVLARSVHKKLLELEEEIATAFSLRDTKNALLVLGAFSALGSEAKRPT